MNEKTDNFNPVIPVLNYDIFYIPLASNVIAVAVTRVDGWAAYIGAVAGFNHDEEYRGVAASGDKLSEHIARAVFPTFDGVKYCK